MEDLKKELIEYMEYLQQKEDVFYGFDDIEKSIDEYLKSRY